MQNILKVLEGSLASLIKQTLGLKKALKTHPSPISSTQISERRASRSMHGWELHVTQRLFKSGTTHNRCLYIGSENLGQSPRHQPLVKSILKQHLTGLPFRQRAGPVPVQFWTEVNWGSNMVNMRLQLLIYIRLWQKKRTQMQDGSGKDRFYFLNSINCR